MEIFFLQVTYIAQCLSEKYWTSEYRSPRPFKMLPWFYDNCITVYQFVDFTLQEKLVDEILWMEVK